MISINLVIILIALGAILLFYGLFTVQQQTVAIVQTLGKFSRICYPGLNFLIPFMQSVAGRVSLRVNQLDVKVETKTEDNVFLHVMVSVQYYINQDRVYEAFYKLQDPKQQITAFVFDVVRARVPKIKLDDVFEKKDEIANAVKEELSQMMNEFGYGIIKTLVTDIDPDKKVKEAMNEINVAQRLRVAATEKGEAERIIKVKSAEADAQSKALQGKGMADQRTAIILGLKDSVADFKGSLPALDERDILNLVLATQYFDTLKDLGSGANHNTIMVPHSPGAIGEVMQQFANFASLSKNSPQYFGAENSSNMPKTAFKKSHKNSGGDLSDDHAKSSQADIDSDDKNNSANKINNLPNGTNQEFRNSMPKINPWQN